MKQVQGEETGVRPSVVFIVLDDCGLVDIGYNAKLFNSELQEGPIATPNIDKLASESVKLTNYYTHTLCGPSRAALLTGRSAHSLGNPFSMTRGGHLDPQFKTAGHEFRSRGYSTHVVGKWGVDFPPGVGGLSGRPSAQLFNGRGPSDGYTPLQRGFDTFFGLYSSGHNHYSKALIFPEAIDWHRHNATHQLDYPKLDPEAQLFSSDLFTREAVSIVDQWSVQQPGFLYLAYTAPHDPLQAPEDTIAPGSACGHIANWRRRYFCGMMQTVDRGVGRIVEHLRAKGLLEHTLIALTSDNGGAPSVGGFNYPLRGQKSTAFEGGIRSPGLLYLPPSLRSHLGALPAESGQYYRGLMYIGDWMPTLLSLVDQAAGQPFRHEQLGADIDGVDQSRGLLQLASPQPGVGAPQPPGTLQAAGYPRADLIVMYDIMMNTTVYVHDHWKLILGSAGRNERFDEPVDGWYDRHHRLRFVFEEVLCDLIDVGLGADWFIFSWALRFMLDEWTDWFNNDPSSSMSWGRIASIPDLGYTLPVTEDSLPTARWDIEQNTGGVHVRLYDLSTDIAEEHNVAHQHRDLIEQWLPHIRQRLRHGRPHETSVQKQFGDFMKTVYRLLTGLAIFLLVVLFTITYLLYRCFCRSSPNKSKRD